MTKQNSACFRVRKKYCPLLALAVLASATPPATDATDTIHVTGRLFDCNGQREVPSALFGVHAFPHSSEDAVKYGIGVVRTITHKVDGTPVLPGSKEECPPITPLIIDCVFDRYQPALILEHSDWKERLCAAADEFSDNRRTTGLPQTIEFWNEPYLNWASKPGVNYNPEFFEKIQEDSRIKYKLKTTGETTELLDPEMKMMAFRKDTGEVHYLASKYALDYKNRGKYRDGQEEKPFNWEDGFEFNFNGIPCILKMTEWLKDKTQKDYYSSEFNARLYTEMLKVFGTRLKGKKTGIALIAGWDCNMWWDNWTPWHTLYKPVIDQAHPFIDGITEHHYGCDTRMVAAEYEVVTTYALSKYGTKIKVYNTEAGGSADPEQPGKYLPDGNAGAPGGNFTYMVRDIIHLLHYYPDKAASRVSHMPQHSKGVLDAFLFLKDLRGQLLETVANVPGVWAVGALNGDRIVLIAFNDRSDACSLNLRIDAPRGSGFASGSRCVPATDTDGNIVLDEIPMDVVPDSKSVSAVLDVRKRSAAKIVLRLSKIPAPEKLECAWRRQFSADKLLFKVDAGDPAELNIAVPESELRSATMAKIRIIHNRMTAENAEILLNGKNVGFDLAGEDWTSEIPVPLSMLDVENVLVLKAKDGKEYFICATSLVVGK